MSERKKCLQPSSSLAKITISRKNPNQADFSTLPAVPKNNLTCQVSPKGKQ